MFLANLIESWNLKIRVVTVSTRNLIAISQKCTFLEFENISPTIFDLGPSTGIIGFENHALVLFEDFFELWNFQNKIISL